MISCIGTSVNLAFKTEALRMLCDLNFVVYIPALDIMLFNQRLIEEDVTAL
jgi:hypothetical protein